MSNLEIFLFCLFVCLFIICKQNDLWLDELLLKNLVVFKREEIGVLFCFVFLNIAGRCSPKDTDLGVSIYLSGNMMYPIHACLGATHLELL